LIQVTVAPTATFKSSGAYARFPSVDAPPGIVMDDDGSPGVGVGEGDGDEELVAQAIAKIETRETIARRSDDIVFIVLVTSRLSQRFMREL
jgi:hypothetical protein